MMINALIAWGIDCLVRSLLMNLVYPLCIARRRPISIMEVAMSLKKTLLATFVTGSLLPAAQAAPIINFGEKLSPAGGVSGEPVTAPA
jgi:uncharacterized protein YhhL (DUF1145 family)